MPTRNISITEHQDRWVESAVANGRYQNASEVFREGVRLLERRDADDEAKLALLRAKIDEAREQVARGEYEELAPGQFPEWLAGLGKTARR